MMLIFMTSLNAVLKIEPPESIWRWRSHRSTDTSGRSPWQQTATRREPPLPPPLSYTVWWSFWVPSISREGQTLCWGMGIPRIWAVPRFLSGFPRQSLDRTADTWTGAPGPRCHGAASSLSCPWCACSAHARDASSTGARPGVRSPTHWPEI